MNAANRYQILLEPVRLGPVVAPNRFYQVPHCNGMGHRHPSGMAEMRAVKAEGGWGVVFTEVCEIHYSGDVSPHVEARLWSDEDIPALALMCDRVHAYGALSGVELGASRLARLQSLHARSHRWALSPGDRSLYEPASARAMTKRDIANFRQWHRAAALRARTAGFDVIAVYASHGLTLPLPVPVTPLQPAHRRVRRHSARPREAAARGTWKKPKKAVGDRCAHRPALWCR